MINDVFFKSKILLSSKSISIFCNKYFSSKDDFKSEKIVKDFKLMLCLSTNMSGLLIFIFKPKVKISNEILASLKLAFEFGIRFSIWVIILLLNLSVDIP